MRRFIAILYAATASVLHIHAQTNLFRHAEVTVSSQHEKYPAVNINDSKVSRASTWMSDRWKRPPHIVEFNLEKYCRIDSMIIWTGIPEKEMSHSEKVQAPGFWCVKNIVMQYWDDANWTDIAETITTENRANRIAFHFINPVTSFRFRLVSTDGEPVRISEVEAYGKIDESLPVIKSSGHGRIEELIDHRSVINSVVTPSVIGKSMKYVGYNQGYFVPGSNVKSWWEYSGVNAARIWAPLSTYARKEWFQRTDDIKSLEDFEKEKKRFLDAPLSRVPMDSISKAADRVIKSTNTMALNYALETLKELGVDIVIQSGLDSYATDWNSKWSLWERFYSLAFYAAAKGNVNMFAMNNEPNHRHAGPMKPDTWIELMRITSDACHCALQDVSRIYGKDIEARFVGPVTAGTNTNWWAKVAAAERIDYRGEKIEHDLIDIFSTHSYNIPAAGYEGRIDMINGILQSNHPEGKTKPIVFTETGRWMNAYLIDKEETMDSPSLFTEWAGMYTKNMLGGCYGMWAFKFANTASSTYPRGIKSGHHFIWKGRRFSEDAYHNLATEAVVTTSSSPEPVIMLNDGDKSDASAWIHDAEDTRYLTLTFEGKKAIGGIAVYSGSDGGTYTAPDRIRAMDMEYLSDGEWTAIPGTEETKSRYAQTYYVVKPEIEAEAIRINIRDKGVSKVREVKVFGPDTLSEAEESYDVSGAQRTAEVVRLFAKGFKDERPLLECRRSWNDPDMDMCASLDSLTGNIYLWLVNRRVSSCSHAIDLSPLGVTAGTKVVYETVGHEKFGEARPLVVSDDSRLRLVTDGQSTGLVTIPPQSKPQRAEVTLCASVTEGRKADSGCPYIEMNARYPEKNSVTYISFKPGNKAIENGRRILLGVHGKTDSTGIFRFHVYCMDGNTGKKLSRANAPCLHETESRAVSVGEKCHVAGEMTMSSYPEYHYIDVTDAVRKHCGSEVTFMLVRELREYGDDRDNDIRAYISGIKTENKPILEIW